MNLYDEFGAHKVDMSPEAIDRRLRELGQLYELGISLQKAKKVGKVAPSPPQTSPPHPSE
jgi:hypothetical protein